MNYFRVGFALRKNGRAKKSEKINTKIDVVVVVVVKYLRGKTGNLMRPTGNGGFL